MPTLARLQVVKLVLAACVLMTQCRVLGQELADAPEPRVSAPDVAASLVARPAAEPAALLIRPAAQKTHQFFDRQNTLSFSAAVAMRSADSAYTCATGVGTTTHNADGSITVHREDVLPVNSCHGVVLMNAAFTGMGLSGSYVLHKLGWHKLERLPNWVVAAVPVYGIAYTATHQHEH
jgi:hypothetical protein